MAEDLTYRSPDGALVVGRRGARIALGSPGAGASPIFLSDDVARWLQAIALPAVLGSPPSPARVLADRLDERAAAPVTPPANAAPEREVTGAAPAREGLF